MNNENLKILNPFKKLYGELTRWRNLEIKEMLDINPRVQYLPEYDMKPDTDWYGIKALCYDGADYKGKKTKVFAHIGYPETHDNKKVPAVVLVHGGGGHAFPEWIKIWNKKGFAAIAMDTTGFIPRADRKGIIGTEASKMDGEYERELYGDLAEEGYILGPNNSAMTDCDLPLSDQWMYHAVSDTILAHNILLNDDKIDKNKIGICGISWGAVITSLAIGYDTRYAFAVPIYGSGYLDYEPSPTLPKVFKKETVKRLWSAADNFDKVSCPVLWKCWIYDAAFSIGANSLSYLATKKNDSYLSMSPDMYHSHFHGWTSKESYRFAECIINNKLPLIKVIDEPKGFSDISFAIKIPEDFHNVSAEVFYLTKPMEYDENNNMIHKWQGVKAEINDNRVTAKIPDKAYCYFVELKGFADGETYTTDTSLIEHNDMY